MTEISNAHRRGNLTKLIGDLLRAGDAKIVGLVIGHVSATAQHGANLVLRFGHSAGISDRADEIFVVLRIVLVIGAIGHHDCFVGGLIFDEAALARFEDADHLVGYAIDHD